MRRGFRAAFAVFLLSTSACTQQPARVELKGHQIFAKSGEHYAAYMPSSGGDHLSPSKYTAPISMGTTQAASTDSISVSELDTPPASVQVKEVEPVKAAVAAPPKNPEPVAVVKTEPPKSLEPVKVVKAEPVKNIEPVKAAKAEPVVAVTKLEPKTAEVQKVNPWTKKPRTEFVEAKVEEPVSKTKSKPVRLDTDKSTAGYIWPVNGSKILSGYGAKGGGKRNDGINIAAASGEPVWASADGEVVYVGNELQGYGNMVLIKHAGGKSTTYAHLSQAAVDKYDRVHQGDIIGYVGNTGSAKKPQLHFAVRDGENFVDPMKFVSRSVASN